MTDIEAINETDIHTDDSYVQTDTVAADTNETGEAPVADEQASLGENTDEACEVTEAAPAPLAELDALRAEISQLREELLKKTTEMDMIRGQLGEFSELFPSVAPEDIPQEVWQRAAVSGSLASAYALYHRREHVRARRVRELNQKNAEFSTGKVGVDSAKEYFTQNEVRAMSRGEVHKNYSKILDSMKRWN